MSGIVDQAKTLLSVAKKGLSAATKILEDPYLPEVSGLVLELHTMQQAQVKPGQTAPAPVKGIGLSKIVGPLRTYVKIQKNPWMLYAGIAAAIGIPFLIGRSSKRCK